jgi:RNA polymerase sigma factor (sigma-70 family)
MPPTSRLLGINQPGGTMLGCRRFSWIAAILVGLIGAIIGFGPIEAATAVGGNALSGQLAGGSAVPPKPPGGNCPPARQGQQQGPKEEPRPSKPTKPVPQLSSKTGRKKGRTDQDQGAAEAVPSAALTAKLGIGASTPPVTDPAEPPTVVTEPNELRVEGGRASQSPESAEKVRASDTDAVLLERVGVLGDESAFEILVARYRPRLLTCARGLVDWHQAEDVVQDTLWCLWTQTPAARSERQFGAWLRRVVERKALNALRRVRRIDCCEPRWLELQAGPAPSEGRSRWTEFRENAARWLEDREINLLEMRYRDGLSTAQLARHQHVPIWKMQRWLNQVIKKCRAGKKICTFLCL